MKRKSKRKWKGTIPKPSKNWHPQKTFFYSPPLYHLGGGRIILAQLSSNHPPFTNQCPTLPTKRLKLSSEWKRFLISCVINLPTSSDFSGQKRCFLQKPEFLHVFTMQCTSRHGPVFLLRFPGISWLLADGRCTKPWDIGWDVDSNIWWYN